jgi:fatty-acid desaturase
MQRIYIRRRKRLLKKVIWGGFIFLAGITGIALLLASTMVTGLTLDGQYSFLWSLKSYQLMPVLKFFIFISIVGAVIGTWGMVEKNS